MARLTFPQSHRLTHELEFDAVYAAKLRKQRGPLILHSKPNDRPHYRLGLSVGKVVGPATRRNRFKRLLREAFRLNHPVLPLLDGQGLDLIIGVRPHEELLLCEYESILIEGSHLLVSEWQRRHARAATSRETPRGNTS